METNPSIKCVASCGCLNIIKPKTRGCGRTLKQTIRPITHTHTHPRIKRRGMTEKKIKNVIVQKEAGSVDDFNGFARLI
jgi:hypothetical protein